MLWLIFIIYLYLLILNLISLAYLFIYYHYETCFIYSCHFLYHKKYFLYLLLFPVLYLTIVLSVLPQGFTISTEGSTVKTIWQIFIIPAHLFSMFCIFYLMYKAARTIKTVEFEKKVTFADFAGEFFLLWFSPIGIWILQPKINKFAE